MSLPSIYDYLPECADALYKSAEEKQPSRVKQIAKTVGAGLLGMGAGTLAGYGAGALAKKLYGGEIPPKYLHPAAALAGAGLSMSYSLYKSHEAKELQRVFESNHNKSSGSFSAK